MSHIEQLAKKIINNMRPWFESMRAESTSTRTERQQAWDSAILAAAEFVRRLDNYDESRAILIHELLSTNLPQRVDD